MAEETKENAGAGAPETQKPAVAAEQSEPNKRKKSKLWLWIAIAVVVLAGGGAAGLVLTGDSESEAAEAAAAGMDGPPGLVSLDTFLVNLHDDDREHYIKLTLRLAVVPAPLAEKVDQDALLLARIRDRILTVLVAKSVAEVSGPLGKEELKREIQAQISLLLESGRVDDVLFSEFVVQ